MNRLTQKDNQGNWNAKGLPWESLHEGATISKEMRERLYGCLSKLRDYEDTGMNPDTVRQLDDFEKSQIAELLKTLGEERRKHRWIQVSDRLPEGDGYILLSFENFSVPLVGRYEADEDGGGKFYVGNDEESCISADLYVNAWMPLPEPYRDEE